MLQRKKYLLAIRVPNTHQEVIPGIIENILKIYGT